MQQISSRVSIVWTLIVLTLLSACQPILDPAVQDKPQNQADRYADPQGRFIVPIPTNWTATEEGGYVVLRDPQAFIEVFIGATEGIPADEAVRQFWGMVEPAFAAEPKAVNEAPSRTGITRTQVYQYESAADQVVQAVSEEREAIVYVTLLRGDVSELSRRSAQVSIILTGFTPAGVEIVDLSGVTPAPLSAEKLAALTLYIEEAMPRFDIPGAAVAVVQNDEVVLMQGFGVRARGSDAPITPQTRMMIGSTGKTMTTLLMAQLVDEGLMTWDTPVQQLLPEFAVADPLVSQQITVRNLVCACTGVPRRDLEVIFNARELTAEKVIESLHTFEFFTDFGEAFQYSNQLVSTGGWVAAAAVGGEYGNLDAAYFALMEERIFAPIGMSNTTFSFEEVVASDNFAMPHGLSSTGTRTLLPVDEERVLLPVAPAGTSWSTVEDMARYLMTELNQGVAPDGTQVVSSENLQVTWEAQVPVTAKMSYGLGWFVDEYKNQRLLQHGGNTLGFTTDFAFLPDSDVGIVVITNARASNDFNQAVRYRLLELLFDQPMEFDAIATLAWANSQRQAQLAESAMIVDAAVVAPFLGRYTNAALGEVEVRQAGDLLLLDAGEFTVEVRTNLNERGEAEGYVIYSGLLIGFPIDLITTEADTHTIVFGEGAEKYEFIPIAE